MSIIRDIQQLKEKIKKLRCPEVLISDNVIIDGDRVIGCYKIAVDSSGEIFYNNSGLWISAASGASGSDFTGIISGGIITWIDNYDYNISPALYSIAGTIYSSPSTNITLDPSDATDDRLDVFVLDKNGDALVITGTPSVNPATPSIDATSQVTAGIVLVVANTTEPDIVQESIYEDNAGTPYSTSSSNAGRLNPNSTNTPIGGTKSIEATAAVSGDTITFTRVAGVDSPGNYNILILLIKNKSALNSDQGVTLRFFNGTTAVSTTVLISDGFYGYNRASLITQAIIIPLSLFGITGLFDKVVLACSGAGTMGFFIDDIKVQYGTVPVTVPLWVAHGANIENTNSGAVGVGGPAPGTSKFYVKGNTYLEGNLDVSVGSATAITRLGNLRLEGSDPRLFTSGRIISWGQSTNGSTQIFNGSGSNLASGKGVLEIDIASNFAGITGTISMLQLVGTIMPASGNQTIRGISITPTINKTGSSSGPFTGIYYNPTLTSLNGTVNRFIDAISGSIRLGDLAGSGTRMVVASNDGTLSTQAIPDSGGGDSESGGNIDSSWEPTFDDLTNCSSLAFTSSNFIRVGKVVHGNLWFSVQTASGSDTLTYGRFTLPIAGANNTTITGFGNALYYAESGYAGNVSVKVAFLGGTDQAYFVFPEPVGSINSRDVRINFSYQIN